MTQAERMMLVDDRRRPIWLRPEVDRTPMPAESFRVYVYLAGRADPQGVACPDLQQIGDACFALDYASARVRQRHAQAAVKDLVERGLVEKRRQREGGRQAPNRYVLVEVEPMPAWRQETEPEPAQAKGIDPVWRDTLASVLFNHTNLRLLIPMQWKQIKDVSRQLQKAGVDIETVRTWYNTVWKKEWPGRVGGSPKPSDIMAGMGSFIEAKQPVPSQIDIRPSGEDIAW